MDFPESYNKHLANSTTTKIGQDMRGILPYNWNNIGFRADTDYNESETEACCFFGNAFTSAVGIEWQNSYASLTAKKLGLKCYNFSQGCVPVDNIDIMNSVIKISRMQKFKPKFYFIQFTDLTRVFNPKNQALTLESDVVKNVKRFVDNFKRLEEALADQKWFFIGCDGSTFHPLPEYITNHKNCLIWNPAFFDKILYGMPGEKWHYAISYGIIKKFNHEK